MPSSRRVARPIASRTPGESDGLLSPELQDDLAAGMSGLQPSMGLSNSLERIDLGDDGPDRSLSQQAGEDAHPVRAVGDENSVEGQVGIDNPIEIQLWGGDGDK